MARDIDTQDETEDTEAEAREGFERFAEGLGGEGRRARAERDEDRDDDRDDDRDEDEEDRDDPDGDEQDEDSGDEPDDDDDDDEQDDDSDEDDDAESDDEEEDDDDDDGLDPEVEAAAARHQLPTTFEDIVRKLPKEARAAARQAFSQRLKEVESGLGRAFQEARSDRQQLAKLQAERKYEAEHRADFIADLIDSDPKLLDQLNEELKNREEPRYRAARAKEIANDKKELEKAAETELQQVEQRRQRGVQVAQLAQRLARDAGVPFRVIDKALYIAVMNSPEKDISDEAIRRIVKQEARDWLKLTGERKTEKKKEYIQRKSKQIRDAKRRVTSRDRGHAPAAGRQRAPKDLRDALTRRAAAILPDAPA